MVINYSFLGLLLLLFVSITTAQLDTHFDDAQVYWPSQYKRSHQPAAAASEGEMFAFPGLRGLRGKRDPDYNKRVPMIGSFYVLVIRPVSCVCASAGSSSSSSNFL
ncbi:hypothetical protein L3Y34_008958 [Caenorhabditis briggsae]|uniref:Uncharacterized protein n=1 Tax=Caenorhabditis briggsae TaxID=6238 RepID=A0AAE9A736_CAEBR|nr:hypothetical protein L3Y34_008958 [Caenorhabditis briggsae]